MEAITLLKQAKEAGFFKKKDNMDQLKTDKDLDPLRNRDDFRQFLESISD